jgi:hypothetical protein
MESQVLDAVAEIERRTELAQSVIDERFNKLVADFNSIAPLYPEEPTEFFLPKEPDELETALLNDNKQLFGATASMPSRESDTSSLRLAEIHPWTANNIKKDLKSTDLYADRWGLFEGHIPSEPIAVLPKADKKTEAAIEAFIAETEITAEMDGYRKEDLAKLEKGALRRMIVGKAAGITALAGARLFSREQRSTEGERDTILPEKTSPERFKKLSKFWNEAKVKLFPSDPSLEKLPRASIEAEHNPIINIEKHDTLRRSLNTRLVGAVAMAGIAFGVAGFTHGNNEKQPVSLKGERAGTAYDLPTTLPTTEKVNTKKPIVKYPKVQIKQPAPVVSTTTTTLPPAPIQVETVCEDPAGVTRRINAPSATILDATAYLINKGVVPRAAKYIVGNFAFESGLNPQNHSGDGGTAWGLAQWHKGRRENGLPPTLHGQLDYALNEMQAGKYYLGQISHDPNATEAQIRRGIKEYEGYSFEGPRFINGEEIQPIVCE